MAYDEYKEGQDTGFASTGATGTSSFQETGTNVKDRVQEKASNLAHQAKEQAATKLSGQKDRAAAGLGSISQALRQTGDNLRSGNQSMVADYVDQAAQQVDHLTGYLKDHSINDLMNEAERFARREPALFFGGAALLGLLAARFFKASTPTSGAYGADYRYQGYSPSFDRSYNRGYDRSYDRSYDRNFDRNFDRSYSRTNEPLRDRGPVSGFAQGGTGMGSTGQSSFGQGEAQGEPLRGANSPGKSYTEGNADTISSGNMQNDPTTTVRTGTSASFEEDNKDSFK